MNTLEIRPETQAAEVLTASPVVSEEMTAESAPTSGPSESLIQHTLSTVLRNYSVSSVEQTLFVSRHEKFISLSLAYNQPSYCVFSKSVPNFWKSL